MPFVNAPFAVSSTSIATRLAPTRFTYALSTGAICVFIGCTVAPAPAVSSRDVIQSGSTWFLR